MTGQDRLPSDSVPMAIRSFSESGIAITPQQKRVLLFLSQGQSNKAIAGRLQVTEATVKAHVSDLLRILGCQNRTQAALIGLCMRFGLPYETIVLQQDRMEDLIPLRTRRQSRRPEPVGTVGAVSGGAARHATEVVSRG